MSKARAKPLAVAVLSTLLAVPSPSVAGGTGSVHASVTVQGLAAALELSKQTAVVDQPVQARVTITNLGPDVLGPVSIELRFDPGGIALRGPARKTIPAIEAEGRAVVAWTIRGRQPGSYLILAQAAADGVTVESAGRLLTIVEAGARPDCSFPNEPEGGVTCEM
jgi:hypothetical protein